MSTFYPLLPASVGSPFSYLADGFYQVAYVVPDVAAAASAFEQTLGSARFMRLEKAEVRNQSYRGQPVEITQNLAFGYAGNLQIEIIEPLTGPSTYTELLDVRPGGGLHHVGVWVDDFDQAVADLTGHGHPMLQYGEFATSTHFAYMDTSAVLGSLLEIFNWDEETQAMFRSIREQTF